MDSRMAQYFVSWIGVAFLLVGLYPLSAQAEWMVSLYGGIAHTLASNVTLQESGNTHLAFHEVPWDDDSFKEPQYFGLRLTYWLDRQSPWGLAVDFAHAKMIAELDERVSVTGSREGKFVNATEALGDSFLKLEFSHGHNLLTANILYRWFARSHPPRLGRLQPYVGLGAGVAIPHVEVGIGLFSTGDYQFAGPGLQALAGLNVNLMKSLSVFAEVRLSYAHLDVDLQGGGSLETDAWTYHFNIGLSLST
jgi:lipid A oxidase